MLMKWNALLIHVGPRIRHREFKWKQQTLLYISQEK